MRPLALLLLAALAVVAGACGETSAGAGAGSDELAGDWRLVAGAGPAGAIELGPGVEVTLTIEDGAWGGTVCNSYGAQGVAASGGEVQLGEVVRTEMACADPAIMAAEDAYLAAFTAVTGYEVRGEQLVLTGDGGTELTYERVVAADPAPLVGTTWQLDTVTTGRGPDGAASSTVATAEPPRVRFAEDGTFELHTGCNGGEGTYRYDEAAGELTVEDVALSAAGCEPLVAEQEQRITAVLDAAPLAVGIDGDRLSLQGPDAGLGFTAVADDGGAEPA